MTRKTTAGVKIKGLNEAIKKQQGIAKRMANSEPGFRVAGPIVTRGIKKMFRSTEGPDGEKWKPKKAIPVKFSGGEPTAFDRGYYVRGKFRPKRKTGIGLTGELSRAASFVARKDNLIVFVNKKYAERFHGGFKGTQKVAAHSRTITRAFGKPLKKPVTFRVKGHSFPVNQVARPFMGATERTKARATRAMTDYWFRGETKVPA